MWYVDVCETIDMAWKGIHTMQFKETSYKDACYTAKSMVDQYNCVLVYKVGGCPLQHHVDGTRTTLYYWDRGIKRCYW